jgi:hypothetical protein
MAKQYKALVGLTYPVGTANIERAKAGKLDAVTNWKRAEPGEVVDDIPAVSVPWLLRKGHIEAVAP